MSFQSGRLAQSLQSLLPANGKVDSSHDRSLPALQSKAMEGQLRHRLEAQVAEAENLRHELRASREHLEQAGAAARASEQRTREGASSKKAAILEEMETLMEEKLCAENTAKGMEQELGQLKERVADAEERAFHDQSRIIHASQEQMAKLEEVRDWRACFRRGWRSGACPRCLLCSRRMQLHCIVCVDSCSVVVCSLTGGTGGLGFLPVAY